MHPFFNPNGIGHPLPNPAPPHTPAHTLVWVLNGIREAPPENVAWIAFQVLFWLFALYLVCRWVRFSCAHRRTNRAHQAALAQSLAAHERRSRTGQARPATGAGEWSSWPPRIPPP